MRQIRKLFISSVALLGIGFPHSSHVNAKNNENMVTPKQQSISLFSPSAREKLLKRFLHYVTFCTTSDEKSSTCPTTEGQRLFAQFLLEEVKKIGLQEVQLDANGYLTATLPANSCKFLPTIGFLAHLDTSPDALGEGVKPRVELNYSGGDILLNKEKNIVLSPKNSPELKNYVGEDLIVTNGETLLGADDKAGVVAILGAMDFFVEHKEIEHGEVKIAFFPDEEIGRGSELFDVKAWGCDWAYTVDGGEIGELEYENFNAASLKYDIQGVNVHPGYAKGKMINALLIANELVSLFPLQETPQNTEGYEGFYHLISVNGEVERASASFIIRDFDQKNFEKRKSFAQKVKDELNKKYPDAVSMQLSDTYYNMREKIEPQKQIVDLASKAMLSLGITPKVKPIRGGTDGAQLSYKGLPCPNLFAGGENFHSRFEYLPLSSLQKASEVVIRIVELVAEEH